MSERWAAVRGYEGVYQVSDMGRIMRAGRMLHPAPDKDGYLHLRLSRGGVRRHASVHRLVAEAFVPGEAAGFEVRHGDGDNQNNRSSNLSWGTHSQNMLDAVKHGTHNETRKTICARGHEFTPENMSTYRNKRVCLTCKRESVRATRSPRRKTTPE